MEKLMSELANDPDLIDIVREFVDEMPERIAIIRQQFDEHNLDELRRTVHQLKGAAGSYGFPTITEAAARAESTIKQDCALADIQGHINELIDLCSRAQAEPDDTQTERA